MKEAQQPGSIKRYMKFVRPYRWQIVGTLLIGIVKFAIPLLIPLLMKYVVDDIVNNDLLQSDEKVNNLVWVMGGTAILFLVIRPPIEYYRQYFAQWTGNKILFDIRDQLFDHIQRLSLKYYSNTKAGEVISRVVHDVEQTKNFVMIGLMNLWLDIATIIIAVAIMLTMDVPLTLVSLLLFPFYAFSVKYFFGRLRSLTRFRSQALAEVQGFLHERVQGIPVIKSFAVEPIEQKNFGKYNANFLERALDHTRWNAKAFAVVNTITDIAPLIVIGYSGYQVIQENLTLGTMVAFIAYIDRLYNPLRRLVNQSTTLTQSIASMDRVFEFIDEPYDITDAPDAKPVRQVRGDVQFDHVSFRYNDEDLDVLQDIHLHIQSGETVALVGMSGGGKSSLISLLPRFYDVTSGRILLDGEDVRTLQVRSLRDQIGIVLQDNILFSESVKENIRLGKPDATDEEIFAAAKAANAHDFIQELPQGYDTAVGERGVKLSGGQKQRVAIARVFLKNPPILVLDEATSALDLESEHMIQEALELLAKDRTTFIVAHRLSTITHADRIVVITGGRIIEDGSHQELMSQKGAYYDLFNVQQLEG
ncbi:ABC transporter ATP-binding protein [Bacillus fonticola]|uniref:ABC transporter ATP-binding protein n=1 Tax=Bacillus fonticola TaxID=2728853 RepID=UPI001D14CE21|nr:ABC transporter ATP-binding protein [Bacillus fonticola]